MGQLILIPKSCVDSVKIYQTCSQGDQKKKKRCQKSKQSESLHFQNPDQMWTCVKLSTMCIIYTLSVQRAAKFKNTNTGTSALCADTLEKLDLALKTNNRNKVPTNYILSVHFWSFAC